MKFADSVRGLLRRWYILVPGLLLVASITVGAWFAIPPGYNRSATQLLIPGESSIPDGQNPYLYLGGLSPAADVLVRAIGSENVMNAVVEGRPGMEIEISRDTTTAGPIILIDVTASSDAAAEEVLTLLIERTATVLDEIQEVENIPQSTRMTVIPVTVDEQSTEQQRGRLLAAAGVGILGTVLVLLVTSLIDGYGRRRNESYGAATRDWDDLADAPGALDAHDVTGSAPVEGTAPSPPRRAPDAPLGTDHSPREPSDDEYAPAAPRPRVRW